MFSHLDPFAGDPILSLNEAFHADPRAEKINLSIGIYFDDEGRIPVLACVRVFGDRRRGRHAHSRARPALRRRA
jgi:aspartate/tyrosine/aromatic aminotransferase